MLLQHGIDRHDDAGSAETTLQAVLLLERLLNWMHLIPIASHPFNRCDLHTIGLYRQHKTGTYRFTIQEDGTTPADAVFAANMRPREMKLMAQKIREQ